MPGGDKTGPQGSGPLTGKRMGNCVDVDKLDFAFQRGFGRRGFGRGFRRGFGHTGHQNQMDSVAIENEIKMLKEQLSFLEKQMDNNQSTN